MQDTDLSDRILARFTTRLSKKSDISPRTKKLLSSARDSRSFGDDEQLLEDLVADEDR